MAFSQTYFQNAHHLEVHGGQFMNIANVTIVNDGAHNDPVSTVLLQHIAHGAIFDSGERYPPGKCHPGTREKMIERIMEWIDDSTPPHRILWLYGPAGAGKSALAYTICEFLAQHQSERYGGSFFFSRGHIDRGKGLKLFVTLSYQLAVHFPSVRAEINEALYRDPSLPTKSMEVQLFSLIIQPILRCRSFPSYSPTLIIDGLDECADDQGMDTQRDIILLISQSIVKYNLPLRFMIASRPESWIGDTFNTSPLPSLTLSLSLRDDEDADEDIKAYLTDEFEKIRVENQRIMGSVVPPWPPANIVDRFVYEASGQYIYASTVLRFVGKFSRFSNPLEQLRILTSPGPYRALAFTELDRLYETIVSVYPRWETMKRVLGGILAGVNSTVMELILGVDPTELTLVLDALSSLIDKKYPIPLSEYELRLEPIFGSLLAGREDVNLSHLSFREFLEDETRSGAFHIHVGDIVQEISDAFFDMIYRNIGQKYGAEPHLSLGIGLATYQHMMHTISRTMISNSDIEIQVPVIRDITLYQRQMLHEPDLSMNYIGCFIQDLHWINKLLSQFSKRLISNGPPTNQQFEPEIVDELNNAILELRILVFLSRKDCIRLLSSSNTFSITPTLVYLNEVNVLDPPAIDEMFTIPWYTTSDILDTLEQHRHIIKIESWPHQRDRHLSLPDLSDNFEFNDNDPFEDDGWRTQNEWKDQRILLMIRFLNAYFGVDGGYSEKNWLIPIHLGHFFAHQNVSAINTREYFQTPSNLTFLTMMSDVSTWTDRSPFTFSGVGLFILPVLLWFNRQLTNPETLGLLDDHDKSIVPKMATAMNRIFEHHFLSHYKIPYHTELYVSTPSQQDSKSIRITVLPLPNGWNQEEIPYVPHADITSSFLCEFHDEVFGKTQDGPPTIDREHWHPYLCSCLLNCLAKDLYRLINPEYKLSDGDTRDSLSKESFAYIVECLPFAETTPQNLDALRAIAYLFPHATLEWDLPIEFWDLSVEFLKKYDRSVLSEEELSLFEGWMHSMVNNLQIMPHET